MPAGVGEACHLTFVVVPGRQAADTSDNFKVRGPPRSSGMLFWAVRPQRCLRSGELMGAVQPVEVVRVVRAVTLFWVVQTADLLLGCQVCGVFWVVMRRSRLRSVDVIGAVWTT